MNALKRMMLMPIASLVLWTYGCNNSVEKPPPPPSPPPINLSAVYNTTAKTFRLLDNDVYDILVDSQGREWFATQSGVSMWDGTTMHQFDEFSGIPNRQCRCLAELNGKIWVGTWGGGVGIYDTGPMWTSISSKNGLVDDQVYAVGAEASSKSLWIGTVNGVSQYKDDASLTPAQRWVQWSDKLANKKIVVSLLVHLDATRGREIWLAKKSGGITVLKPQTSTSIQYTPATSGNPSQDVSGITYDATTDLFWASLSTAGIVSVDVPNKVWKRFSEVNGLVSDLATSVAVQQQAPHAGWVWVSTLAGVTLLKSDGTTVNYIRGSGMPTDVVRKVYVDPNDDVWLAFINGGAARIKN